MKNNRLTEGNILSSLLRFAIPIFAALFLQAMYGAVDLLVVGKFAKIADQSGVATGSMFTTTFANVITCFAIGVTVLIGEAIGSGRGERASKGIGTGIVIFLVMAVIATVLLIICAERVAVLMHAPQDALTQTTQYIRVCGAGIVFIIAYNVLGAIFRGIGDSKTPLLTVAIACVVNIVGDLIFIIVFHMGAAGAALATVLAQAVSVVISLAIIRCKKLPFQLKKSDIRWDAIYAKKIFSIGLPVALQELLVGISFIFIQSTVNAIGLIESAAIGVGEKVCAFLMLVASAYMQAMAAFVAQNNGAGKHDRAKKALQYGIQTAFAAGLMMGLLAFFGGSLLAGLFSNDLDVITAAHSYLRAYAIDCLLTAILFCFIGYFNGCERTMFVMVQGIVGAFGIRVPLVMLFSHIGNGSLFLIGLATPISSVVQITLCITAFIYYERKNKKNLFCD
ncbi:MAG: MATE family efflux transporter [bacterium]|nr:MATE family efflux transporter [bacterium]